MSGGNDRYENCDSKIYATNLGAPFIPQFFKDKLHSLLKSTDLLVSNESEAVEWSKISEYGHTTDSLEDLESIIIKMNAHEKH